MTAKSALVIFTTVTAITAAIGCTKQHTYGNDTAGQRLTGETDSNGMAIEKAAPAAGMPTESGTTQSTDTSVPDADQAIQQKKSRVQQEMNKTRPGTEHDL